MKKLILILVIVLSSAGIHAQPGIEVKAGNIIFNKHTISRPWTYTEFTGPNGLGIFDRKDLGGGNDIFTYDKTGIMLYRTPKSNTISAFNVYFGKDPDDDHSFNPKENFNGKIVVEGFFITSTTSIAAVQKALPEYNFEMSLIGAYRGEHEGLYIYLKYDTGEKHILWSSIGRNDY